MSLIVDACRKEQAAKAKPNGGALGTTKGWDLSRFSNECLIKVADAISEDLDRPVPPIPGIEVNPEYVSMRLSMWAQFNRLCDILRERGVDVESEVRCPEE